MNLTTIKDKLAAFGRKVWAYMKVARIELIVIAALIFADLLSKGIIGLTMDVGQDITAIPEFLHIHYIRNYHAAFGSAFGLEKILGQTAIRIIFIVITIAAIGVFGYFLHKNRGKNLLMRLSLAMIIAGAFGNLVDRLFLGYVRDFVEIYFFGLDLPLLGTSFAIFNIADAELTVGVVCFLIYFLFLYHEPKKEPAPVAAPAASVSEAVSDEGLESMPDDGVKSASEAGEKSVSAGDGGESAAAEVYESMPENTGISEKPSAETEQGSDAPRSSGQNDERIAPQISGQTDKTAPKEETVPKE